MKRIISAMLCFAMLFSVASMSIGAVGELESKVTTENVMSITTDKDIYKPGDTVVITASMESIWGDPALEDDILGYEGYALPGAYGMELLCANLIYDTEVFTAKAHKSLLAESTIINADADEATVQGNNPIEAKNNGAYYLMAQSDIWNADYDGYGFFNGSGDLWQWKLTIAEDAAPGTYYLPVGPYVITEPETDGLEPVIKFYDRYWAWVGNCDSLLQDREVEYKTGYTGPSLVDTSDPVTAAYGTEYECSYVPVVIGGGISEDDLAAANAVIELIDAIGTVTYESGAAIERAEMAYAALTDDQKALVTNYTDLVEARFIYDSLADSDCSHVLTESVIFPASCLTDGYEIIRCIECGEEFCEYNQPATGHSYESEVTDATCTEDGYETLTCMNCGEVEITVISAKGHECCALIEEPTCTEDGYESLTCMNCGYSESNAIPATGHSLYDSVMEPTCTTDGEMIS